LMLLPSSDITLSEGNLLGITLFLIALIFTAIYYYFVHERLLPQYVKEALERTGEKKSKKARKVAK